MAIISTKNKHIVVETTGHPAHVKKIRCPKCSLGYCVEDAMNENLYKCDRCGHSFQESSL
jgi:DNA-directed RNA polymerase subunit RPC12/RpoP